MRNRRVHVTGASGSGVTTLGRALAGALALPHHDTDDYYWLPTEPPYTAKRLAADRIRLMQEMFIPRTGWVLSGSLVSWARHIEPSFDAVVYVSTPTPVRLARLRAREETRHGRGATAVGGSRHEAFAAFIAWASGYDEPTFDGRSRAAHERWLGTLTCRIARVDGTRPTEQLVAEVLRDLEIDP